MLLGSTKEILLAPALQNYIVCKLTHHTHAMFYLFFCSAFEHPHPPLRLVLDSVSEMVFHIQRSLAAATIKMNQLCLDMNTDVFRFLFNGKGMDAGKAYKEYKLSDFDKKYFLGEWYMSISMKMETAVQFIFP